MFYLGWQCIGGSPTSKDTCTPICGDSIRIGPETCDDENTSPDDGCNSLWLGRNR